MLRSRLFPCLAAFATAAALAACGDDSGDPGALSKSEFASKAYALCAETETERTRLIQQLSPQPSGQTDAQTFQQLARADRELVRRVDALVPPDAEQDQVDRILDGWRQRAELEESNATQAPQSLASFAADVAQIDAHRRSDRERARDDAVRTGRLVTSGPSIPS